MDNLHNPITNKLQSKVNLKYIKKNHKRAYLIFQLSFRKNTCICCYFVSQQYSWGRLIFTAIRIRDSPFHLHVWVWPFLKSCGLFYLWNNNVIYVLSCFRTLVCCNRINGFITSRVFSCLLDKWPRKENFTNAIMGPFCSLGK